jgi:hypothetical protein
MVASSLIVFDIVKNRERYVGVGVNVKVFCIYGFHTLDGAEGYEAGLRAEIGPTIRATSQINTFLGDVCKAQGHSYKMWRFQFCPMIVRN